MRFLGLGGREQARIGNPNHGQRDGALTASIEAAEHTRLQREYGLTAAGFRVKHEDSDQLRRLIQPWQSRSFSYYDQVGEIWYASQFYARMMALLKLYPAKKNADGDWEKTDDPKAVDALDRIRDPGGGDGEREGLMSAYGRLMFISGEAYLLCSTDKDTGLEQWEMLSTDELRVQSGVYVRYRAPTMAAQTLHEIDDEDWTPVEEDEGVVYRLWRRHPRYSYLADAPMKGVLDIVEELIILTRAVRSRARSRLAGPGILAISEDFSHAPLEATPDEDPAMDPFLSDLKDAMISPISNEGAASAVVPIVIRGTTEAVQNGIKHIQIIDPTQLYPETGLRYECIKRIALGLDMPPEILLGLQDSNHWPCDEKTEVLTADRGFVTHDQLAEGDIVLGLDHTNGRSEWVPISGVRREHVEAREMVRVKTKNLDALTTPDHRWPILRDGLRVWTDSESLDPADRIIRAVPHSRLPEHSIYSDDFVRLVAWFVSEGTCTWPSERHCQVRIGQSHLANPDKVAEIGELLGRLFGPASDDMRPPKGTPRGAAVRPTWREDREPRGMTLFHLNKAAYGPLLDVMESWRSKVMRLEFVYALPESQLELLLSTFALGDGNSSLQGGLSINQRDPARLVPLATAAILLGRPVSFTRQPRRGGFSDGIQHYLRVPITRGHDVPAGRTSRETYTGVIFCPKVPATKSFLARRNGKVYFTGNSSWQVDEQTWKAHGQPAANQFVNDLTTSYFLPELRSQDVKDWEMYSIQYDATDVINHPDRGKDAMDAYNSRAIGKKALREAKGFEEGDAPTQQELEEMIGVAVRDGSLALFGAPKVTTGGVETEPGEIVGPDDGNGAAAGNEVTPGPPKESTGASEEKAGTGGSPGEPTSVVGSALEAARFAGAADVTLRRCREVAGNRLLALAKKEPGWREEIEQAGIRAAKVAWFLGRDRVRKLAGSESDLIANARAVLEETLVMWDLSPEARGVLMDQMERHAVRTLYDENPSPLPERFHTYVAGVLANGV